ncbi:MAG: translocation/assembly module TamB domain-containing protein [Deltaproteobacteria bacterium]|nr:translocation/assembly module TamB domain-containing protein [Deltaproteobacteria bacterium]
MTLSAAVFWVMKTSEGSIRTLEILGMKSGIEVEIRDAEGNFLDGLTLRDAVLRCANITVQIRYMRVEAAPGSFLTGFWSIKKVHMDGITVSDRRPGAKKEPNFSWPAVDGFIAALRGRIGAINIQNIEYTRLDGPPVQIERINGRLIWKAGMINLPDILIDSSRARIQGAVTAGFRKPSLQVKARMEFPEPLAANTKTLLVKADLKEAALPEQLAGSISVKAVAVDGKQTEAIGILGLTPHTINFRNIRLKKTGWKGVVMASGEAAFPDGQPFYKISSKMSHWDLASEIRFQTDITGTLTLEGSPAGYTGRFSLSNTGESWRAAVVTGTVTGGGQAMTVTLSSGAWLTGDVTGEIGLVLKQGVSLNGSLQGNHLNPGRLFPNWDGTLNMTATGHLQWKSDSPPEGRVNVRLLESRLRGKILTGTSEVRLHTGDVILADLDLHHEAFDLHASGNLKKRLDYSAFVNDFSGLLPGARGRFSTAGWVRLQDGLPSFSIKGEGEDFSIQNIRIGTLSYGLTLDDGKDGLLNMDIHAQNLKYKDLTIETAVVQSKGTLSSHTIIAALEAPPVKADALLSGSYHLGTWRGTLDKLSGQDHFGDWHLSAPAGLTLSRSSMALSPTILGSDGEQLDLRANLILQPLAGNLGASWKRIRLKRLSKWFAPADVDATGETAGKLAVCFDQGALKGLSGDVTLSGKAVINQNPVAIDNLSSSFNWNGEGLTGLMDVSLGKDGSMKGHLSSPLPVGSSATERGRIDVTINDVNLPIFEKWYPAGVSLSGRASGSVGGYWMPGSRFDLAGKLNIASGAVTRQGKAGRIQAAFRNASADFVWRKEALSGRATLILIDHGQVRASFKIPLPAKYPFSIQPSGPLTASIQGQLQEAGMINAVFPGLIEETKGTIDLDVSAGGSWKNPQVAGRMEMTGAEVSLPMAGIRLQDIRIKAHMKDQKIIVDTLTVSSGSGTLNLQAEIGLQDRRVLNYSGTIKGSNFRTVDLPELQMSTSPNLRFQGDAKTLTVRGHVMIPQGLLLGRQGPPQVMSSRDVIIVDAPLAESKKLPIGLDVRISVILGDEVRADIQGASLRLIGNVELTAMDLEHVAGKGTIRIAEGRYSAYGVDLNIDKGRILFNGPIDKTQIDITAVRKLEEVTAGILMTGTLSSPVIQLYSVPSMPDPDILAYLVLGHPLQGNEQDLSLLVRAAVSMLPKSKSDSAISQLMHRMGLDDVDIKVSRSTPADSDQAGLNGSTPSGLSAVDQIGLSGAMVTIGKYLTPKLYVSFGRYLFSDASVVRLRYKFSESWELETHGGTITGADLYYKIEFH